MARIKSLTSVAGDAQTIALTPLPLVFVFSFSCFQFIDFPRLLIVLQRVTYDQIL